MLSAKLAAESLPLKNLEEVRSWKPHDGIYRCGVPLVAGTAGERRPKVLACHDMKGGYLEDRFTEGTVGCETYVFWHWWNIDTFVYFSHYFVTIPPLCWISAGHRHQVKVLGTLITEWDDGKQICTEFLKSETEWQRLADQLVAIAAHYGFDGWLLNIENTLQIEEVPVMRSFVEYLTVEMHGRVRHSEVIWYDSVTHNGELKWQDALNEQNREFFDASDGIFLNYGWKESSLQQSKQLADELGRSHDVYVGVDVFGRGCYGNGGFNTVEDFKPKWTKHLTSEDMLKRKLQAVKMARKCDLSVAIFAHGWTNEIADSWDEFIDNECRFWNLLKHECPQRSLSSLPLSTSFCRGWGNAYSIDGEVVFNQRWTNITIQQVQPNIHISESCTDEGQNLYFTTDEAFNGGGCLQLSAAEDGSRSVNKLFLVDAEVEADLYVSYTFKLESPSSSIQLGLSLMFDRPALQLCLVGNKGSVDDSKLCVSESACCCYPDEQQSSSTSWITRSYLLPDLKNFHLKQVSVVTAGRSNSTAAKLYLGQITMASERCGTELGVAVPLEGCLTCDGDPLPSSSCHGTWVKTRLCWLVAGDIRTAVSHYIVWTCCPATTVRTLARPSSQSAAADKSCVVDQPDDTVPREDERAESKQMCYTASQNSAGQDLVESPSPAPNISCLNATVPAANSELDIDNTAEPDSSDGEPPAKIRHLDDRSAENETETDSVGWRCLGITPVASFSFETNSLLDYSSSFRVQPVLFTGTVLPPVNVVTK